jgi:peptide-methionine (R)-S-oxide reductase
MGEKITKTNTEWKNLLTPEQFYVTRQKGTERAGTGEYADNKDDGIYQCVCCGLPLFASEHKFDSGTGWPSFDTPMGNNHVAEEEDRGLFRIRTEVLCGRCDAHLGHVFPDGPPETTGLRYCINSAALTLEPSNELGEDKQ